MLVGLLLYWLVTEKSIVSNLVMCQFKGSVGMEQVNIAKHHCYTLRVNSSLLCRYVLVEHTQ